MRDIVQEQKNDNITLRIIITNVIIFVENSCYYEWDSTMMSEMMTSDIYVNLVVS